MVIIDYVIDEEEAKRLRRRYADWNFINGLPPRLREAIKFYIEKGDIRLACKLAGLGIEEFRELLRKAKVPVII